MKKRSIAFLLSLVMLLSLLTPTALAEEPDQEAQATEERTEIPALSETAVAVPREAAFGDETTVTAPEGAESYQWQFRLMEGLWVNISGDESAAIVLTYAKVCNMLDESGAASLRCLVDGAASETLTVTVTDEPAQEPEPDETPVPDEGPVLEEEPVPDEGPVLDEEPVIQPVLPILDPQQSAEDTIVGVSNSAVGVQEGQDDETPAENTQDTYSIVINYVFKDGKEAAGQWTAVVEAGGDFYQVVENPSILGYAPEEDSVIVDVKNISKDEVYDVIYYPAKVDYTVKHYQQNLTNDNYTLFETEEKQGLTESAVGDKLAKNYDGFTALLYDAGVTIAADGSTEVEIYYDRNYYLITFDLDGGYGVEPIYARYGATISTGKPEKPGYTFWKWTNEEGTEILSLPTEMPAKNRKFTAHWKEGVTDFTVVFWYENADDTAYSVAGTYKPGNVAPGTEKKSGDYKDQSFTGRDDTHFSYNTKKTETVTVKGDGSTVLNVYFARNSYTLTFKDGQITLTCTKTEHTHSDSCCKYGGTSLGHWYHRDSCCKLGLSEHTHNSRCYKTSDLTITAKWGADIRSYFPIRNADGRIMNWRVSGDISTVAFDVMPDVSRSYSSSGTLSDKNNCYYYLEIVSGSTPTTETKPLDGMTFALYKKVPVPGGVSLTYDEEFHDIAGFTQYQSDPEVTPTKTPSVKEFNYFYYIRNRYELKFYNYNAFVSGHGGQVQYEAPLKQYNFVPDYPDKLEKGAYVFGGWYTTEQCLEGTEVNWETITMPIVPDGGALILHAKWVPATHKVTTWLTDEMKTPVNVGETGSNTQDVSHGSTATAPAEPKNGNYQFVGWFYKDNGVEKAFDFSMPVNKDLDLYAKWSSNTLVKYTIRYAVENGDGTLTYIAEETEGSALAGTTKTFDAKTGNELDEGYQTGFYPKESSHSITMDINGTDENGLNQFTFIYVQRAKVNYTVRYLEKGTERVLHEEKSEETSAAVITEKFVPVPGYMPDAYQKRLVLSVDDKKNVIIFWYTADEEHAPLQIIHWVQNISGSGYTEKQSSTNLNALLEKDYTADILTIPGFRYTHGTRVVGESTTEFTAPTAPNSGKLTAEGAVLNLYYDRIDYPYEFRFVEQGSDPEKTLADPTTGTARYQERVEGTAKDIPGYELVSSEKQYINIDIEESETATKNVKPFYYRESSVTIRYVAVTPDMGSVSIPAETIKAISDTAEGSTPTAKANYKFVGWFKDAACTESVSSSWVNAETKELTPQKEVIGQNDKGQDVLGYKAATYYAKFDLDVFDLTITKKGTAAIDENQSFIFEVTGPNGYTNTVTIQGDDSVTIRGLTVGEYTVTEKTSWSWRYQPDGPHTITADNIQNGAASVTVKNTRTLGQWLNGCSYAINRWINNVVLKSH